MSRLRRPRPRPASPCRCARRCRCGTRSTGSGLAAAHDAVATADEIGQYQGFTLYATDLAATGDAAARPAGRRGPGPGPGLPRPPRRRRPRPRPSRHVAGAARPGARGRLEILVEDQGRVDYGPRIGEPKGLIGPVSVAGRELRGWEVRPMPLDDITAVAGRPPRPAGEPANRAAGRPGLRPGGLRPPERGRPVPDNGGLGQGRRLGQRLLPGPVLVTRTAAHALRARPRDPAGRQRTDHSRAARRERGGCLPPRSRSGPY